MKYLLTLMAVLVFVGAYFYIRPRTPAPVQDASIKDSNMKITSSVFKEKESIPSVYTCDGRNINPPLSWEGVPPGTKSLALIMDDPDVPKTLRPDGMFVHWVVFNIPPDLTTIEEGKEPKGTAGANSRGQGGYTGPCPPDREHRYFFKLYALDTLLDLPTTTNKETLLSAMNKHIISSAELIGLYERKK